MGFATFLEHISISRGGGTNHCAKACTQCYDASYLLFSQMELFFSAANSVQNSSGIKCSKRKRKELRVKIDEADNFGLVLVESMHSPVILETSTGVNFDTPRYLTSKYSFY